MTKLEEQVRDFLGQKRIAVAGFSRSKNQAANAIYWKLKVAGHEVFAVNPRAETVEEVKCYESLEAIPGGVSAVVVATPPAASEVGGKLPRGE